MFLVSPVLFTKPPKRIVFKNKIHRYVVRIIAKLPLGYLILLRKKYFPEYFACLKNQSTEPTHVHIFLHSMVSRKNSEFRALSPGKQNCAIPRVSDFSVALHTAAILQLEVNEYERSSVIAQVVHRCLLVPWREFDTRAVYMGRVVSTVTLGQVYLKAGLCPFSPLYSHSTSADAHPTVCFRRRDRPDQNFVPTDIV
jgi:hypothetical protein